MPISFDLRTMNRPSCEGRLSTIAEEKMVFDFINFGGVPHGETDKKRCKRA